MYHKSCDYCDQINVINVISYLETLDINVTCSPCKKNQSKTRCCHSDSNTRTEVFAPIYKHPVT